MSYIKKDKDGTFYVSFSSIGFKTSNLVAARMGNEVQKFLKKTRRKKLDLCFGGYARLSKDFADTFVKKIDVKKYEERMIFRQIHVFDQLKLTDALENSV